MKLEKKQHLVVRTNVSKDGFSRILKELHIKKNRKQGFRTTGIYPLNRENVLEWLPKAIFEESLISMTEHLGKEFWKEF